MLKNLALCNCIQYISHDDTIKNDISTSIFMELSDFNPKVWKSIDSLSAVAASEVQPSQIADYNGQKPYLKGCIDFYHSKRLDSLVKTFNKGYEK